MNGDNDFFPELTKKDLRDISKIFEEDVIRVHAEPDLCMESKELLLCALHHCLFLSKRMAKKKFTPKKYRYWENS